MNSTPMDVTDTPNEAKAKPLYPYILISSGVNTQVRVVQITIKTKVTLTFPMAFRKLVSGVEIEEKTVLSAKNVKDKIAGSHFVYFGIKSIKNCEYKITAAAIGKIKNDTKNNDFSSHSCTVSLGHYFMAKPLNSPVASFHSTSTLPILAK